MTGSRQFQKAASEGDGQAVLEAVQLGLAWLEELDDATRERLPFRLLQVLFEATHERLAKGVSLADAKFTAKELADELDAVADSQTSDPLRRVRENWSAAVQALSDQSDLLAERARRGGCEWLPKLEKSVSGGGRNRPSWYGVVPDRIQQDELAQWEPTTPPSGGVEYTVHNFRSLPWHLRWVRGLALTQGRGRALFAMLLASVVWFTIVSELALLAVTWWAGSLYSTAMTASVALLVPWFLLGPFLRVLHFRVIQAPTWWWLRGPLHYQLQYARMGRDAIAHSAREPRRLDLLCYEAECPRCGGRVSIESGGLTWWGRLVGRCSEAPREHVYTFDHITRVGAPLR